MSKALSAFGRIKRPGPVVEVDWVDSTGQEGWNAPEAVYELPKKMSCLSAGYLIVDEPSHVVIALGHGGFGGHLSTMAIPRVAIRSIKRLTKDIR